MQKLVYSFEGKFLQLKRASVHLFLNLIKNIYNSMHKLGCIINLWICKLKNWECLNLYCIRNKWRLYLINICCIHTITHAFKKFYFVGKKQLLNRWSDEAKNILNHQLKSYYANDIKWSFNWKKNINKLI